MNYRAVLAAVTITAYFVPSGVLKAQSSYEPYQFDTAAGALPVGSTDGITTAARFNSPASVAADSNGNLYVADSQNNTIRKIAPNGAVTTLAGLAGVAGTADGNGSTARFQRPLGVATDSFANVYVADTDNSTIRKITPSGNVTTIAGVAQTPGSDDGTGSAAKFAYPTTLAIDSSDNIYVTDFGNNTIRKISAGAVVTTLAGAAGVSGSSDGIGASATFNHPWGIAVDSTKTVFVVDYQNCTIRKISPAGLVSTFAGTAGAVGSADGSGSSARFSFPSGIAVDAFGNLFVADTLNHVLRKITSSATVTTIAGLPNGDGFANGVGSVARFNYPQGLVVGAGGRIYVADYRNNMIRSGAPADFTLRIKSVSRTVTNSMLITGVATPGQSVNIQAAPDFLHPYTTIATVQADVNGNFQYEDQAASGFARRFYQVVAASPPVAARAAKRAEF